VPTVFIEPLLGLAHNAFVLFISTGNSAKCGPAKRGRTDIADAEDGVAPAAIRILSALKPLAPLRDQTEIA